METIRTRMLRLATYLTAFVLLFSFGTLSVHAATPTVNVSVDGTPYGGGVLFREETTCVAIRSFSEAMSDCEITWDEATKTATVRTDDLTVHATVGAHYIEANGRYFYTPLAIFIYNETMYLPIRLIAKAFDATVGWDGATYSVAVERGSGSVTPGSQFYASDEVYWLSRIIHAESAGQPLLGKIAVGNVVLNRMAHPSYPNTIYGVIFDRKYGTQFEPVLNGTVYRTPNAESVIAAKICLEGYTVSDEILFFYNPVIAQTNWIARNREFFAVIGDHWFYY
ncbi:MAG: cell wall hydrolase [Clostridia bacterium]|nr:cell wall hydrolase [Clostridia bacterium]